MNMSELHHTLQGLHEELRQAERLDPDDRALLESLLGDIRRLLDTTPAGSEPAGAKPHGDALEGAAVRLEAGHPGVAGAIRAVLDALGKAGI
jgi:predicted component of type VI protein secretion system